MNGRGSRVTSRGLKNFDNYFLTWSNRNFVFPVSVLFYIKPSGIMCFLACSRLSLVETG